MAAKITRKKTLVYCLAIVFSLTAFIFAEASEHPQSAKPSANQIQNRQHRDQNNPKTAERMRSLMDAYARREGDILVQFDRKTTQREIDKAKAETGVASTEQILGPKGYEKLHVVRLKKDISEKNAIERLKKQKGVVSVEVNHRQRARYLPSDSYFDRQWGLNNTGQTINGTAGSYDQDIDATQAWDIEDGYSNPVTVAVCDSGIDLTHTDLNAQIWTNTDESSSNNIDDDNNDYIDDICGYNWAGISQTYLTNWWDVGYDTNSRSFAQSIKGTGQILTHVGVLILKSGSPPSSMKVSVRSSLSGYDLASFTISPGEVSDLELLEIYKPLSSSILLENGKTYYLMFLTTGIDPNNYYSIFDNWSYASYDIYRDGCEYQYADGSWVDFPEDDFYFRTNPNPRPYDDEGHGTHVSGIIAAESENSQGISGVSFGAKLMPLKVLDSSGYAFDSDIIASIYYAADNGAKVINLSLGGYEYSALYQDAIDYAASKGAVVCAAAEQTGSPDIGYPEGYNNVLGVSAVDNRGQIASSANFNNAIDLCAPGVDVYSTMPYYPVAANSLGFRTMYDYSSGSSMACPHVSGAASLILARNPSLTPQEVTDILLSSADDLGSIGRDDYYGYGRVNTGRAVLQTTASPSNHRIHVASHNPQDLMTDVDADTEIAITFSEPYSNSSMRISVNESPSGSTVTGWVTYDTDNVATFHPSSRLKYETRYVVSIPENIRGINGHRMLTPYSFSFTTSADNDPPVSLIKTVPPGPDGNDGWFRSQVSAEIYTTDSLETVTSYYSWNPPLAEFECQGPWSIYDQAIIIPEGSSQICYYSKDLSDNVGTIFTRFFRVDTQRPEISVTFPETGMRLGKNNPIIEGLAVDESSGLAETRVILDGATIWQKTILQEIYSDTISAKCAEEYIDEGDHVAKIQATDKAGNNFETIIGFSVLYGDVNGSRSVDIFDLVIAGRIFGFSQESPLWDDRADLNSDSYIDIFDLVIIGRNFGREI